MRNRTKSGVRMQIAECRMTGAVTLSEPRRDASTSLGMTDRRGEPKGLVCGLRVSLCFGGCHARVS